MTPNAILRHAPLLTPLWLGGCGTVMTRPYEPVADPPEAIRDAAFGQAFDNCVFSTTGLHAVAYDGGRTSTGVGLGGTAAGGTVAMGAATGVGGWAGVGIATVALPVAIGYGATRGIAVLNRNDKEKEIQAGVTACMEAKGFHIVGWKLVKPGDASPMTTPVAKPSKVKPQV